jgi:hypothetical protein
VASHYEIGFRSDKNERDTQFWTVEKPQMYWKAH